MEDKKENILGISDNNLKNLKVGAVIVTGLLVAYYVSSTHLNILQIKKLKKMS